LIHKLILNNAKNTRIQTRIGHVEGQHKITDMDNQFQCPLVLTQFRRHNNLLY